MERKLEDYLPYVIRSYPEYRGIVTAEQPEFEKAWASMDHLLSDQFILTADESGLARWEQILEISPKGTDTLDDRRFKILTRINEELPYTLPQLRNILNMLCRGEYKADQDAYRLIVRVGLLAKKQYDAVESLLDRVAPSNMKIDLSLLYNQHSTLARFTHAQLAAFTHTVIRNEVL